MHKIDVTTADSPSYEELDLSEATRKFIAERDAKSAPPPALAKPRWFELDRFTAYRDVPLVVGFASVVAGVALWTVPGALIVGGVGLIIVSWMMSR